MTDITETTGQKAVAAALDVAVDDHEGSLIDMLTFLGTTENKRYDAIFADVLNLYINASRVMRGNTLMGPDDAHAVVSIMGWIRMMKPVNATLSAYAGSQYRAATGQVRTATERRQ